MSQALSSGKLVDKTAHPQSVMVWCGITSDGKTPMVFVDPGVKFDKDYYLETILKDTLKPWARNHLKKRHGAFNRTPPLTKQMSFKIGAKKNFLTSLPPTNGPRIRLNPMDFSIWAV